jgi:glycosyltransferase involved in cell wall biosynthesis
MKKFTVIIPTHNHTKLIKFAIESVLGQTEKNWELFIIGDGCPEALKRVVLKYQEKDNRITFIQKPKGPRNGEIYRDEVIKTRSTGKYISYLSDDDMYFPDHLTLLGKAFELGGNFISTFGVNIEENSDYFFWPMDLSDKYFRDMLVRGENRIPLSNAAHTRRLYDLLPFGWRTTPQKIPTDLYMWQQILRSKYTEPRTVFVPTVLHFASVDRKTWSEQKRVTELMRWLRLLRSKPNLIREEMALRIFEFSAKHEKYIVKREEILNEARTGNTRDRLNQILDSKIGWLVKAYFGLKEK